MRRVVTITLALLFSTSQSHASIFGEETIVLAKMLSNQLIELERLADSVGLATENRDMLRFINEGIDRTTRQIEAVQSIISRSQGLGPNSVKNLSDLNSLLSEAKSLSVETEALLKMKIEITDQAIAQGALQADTTYRMGQEMIGLGAELSGEAHKASPGRATQIAAAANTSQMLSSGVMLQNMAQQTQLLAMNLEIQKSLLERELKAREAQQRFFHANLAPKRAQPQRRYR